MAFRAGKEEGAATPTGSTVVRPKPIARTAEAVGGGKAKAPEARRAIAPSVARQAGSWTRSAARAAPRAVVSAPQVVKRASPREGNCRVSEQGPAAAQIALTRRLPRGSRNCKEILQIARAAQALQQGPRPRRAVGTPLSAPLPDESVFGLAPGGGVGGTERLRANLLQRALRQSTDHLPPGGARSVREAGSVPASLILGPSLSGLCHRQLY